ncbi:MAG TPA: M1 family metallopeptidase [Pyrinomonadaceae bacterium]|nr:M1 family metallopeptidase [Pyrinomonadaceae bacterium]
MATAQLILTLSLVLTWGWQTSMAQPAPTDVDVLHYNVLIEPDLASKTVKGKVRIRFVTPKQNPTNVAFDCGALTIDAVRDHGVAQVFNVKDKRLLVTLSERVRPDETRELDIEYHGQPRYGIRFFPEQQQVYTVFSTSQWMVCVDSPADRATLQLSLILPAGLTPVANGRLIAKKETPENKVAYQWEQKTPIPSYVFGFAAGPFRTFSEKKSGIEYRHLGTSFTPEQLQTIFRDTADMVDFYESRAGVRYVDASYTQVLAAGGPEQEMSSFTALSEAYAKKVLANDHDVWLGAHELAHQWWGIMVTARDWNHFWLNEGLATFMAAAYLEHRFGRADYLREIESYRKNYERVLQAGHDKSLVFPDWNRPTADDRTLVYDKGAYVLHLLREEMGEQAFWAGLKAYTRAFYGKSVVTSDFQKAMEQAAGKSLQTFFNKWVYLKEVGK